MHTVANPPTPDVNLGHFPLSGGAPKELRPPETMLPTRPVEGWTPIRRSSGAAMAPRNSRYPGHYELRSRYRGYLGKIAAMQKVRGVTPTKALYGQQKPTVKAPSVALHGPPAVEPFEGTGQPSRPALQAVPAPRWRLAGARCSNQSPGMPPWAPVRILDPNALGSRRRCR